MAQSACHGFFTVLDLSMSFQHHTSHSKCLRAGLGSIFSFILHRSWRFAMHNFSSYQSDWGMKNSFYGVKSRSHTNKPKMLLCNRIVNHKFSPNKWRMYASTYNITWATFNSLVVCLFFSLLVSLIHQLFMSTLYVIIIF